MLYYSFGDKEGLFIAVLKQAYARIRKIEAELDLTGLDRKEALRTNGGLYLRLPECYTSRSSVWSH